MVNPVSHTTSAPLNNPVLTGAKYCLMVVLGVAVITASAKTTVPFWPIPMTLQTMAIMAIAVATGPHIAVATMLAYLAGYLIAAGFVGALARGRGAFGRFVVMMAGMVPVYLLGLVGLSGFVASEKAVALGFTPFILGDTIKIALVAFGGAAITRLTKRKPSNRADAA